MRLNLDQPSARRSTEIKICPDIENMPEIMINNLAHDVQNIRRIKTSSNVASCALGRQRDDKRTVVEHLAILH